MRVLRRHVKLVFATLLVLAPWCIHFCDILGWPKPKDIVEAREGLIQFVWTGPRTFYHAFALFSAFLVLTLLFGSGVARRLFARFPRLADLYFDPKLGRLVLISLGLLFWLSAGIYWFEKPFSVPPLGPDETGFFGIDYAHAVWGTLVYVLGGVDITELRSATGRVLAVVLVLANLAVIAFAFAAYKERLERRLRQHQLKDKPEGMQLRGHMIVFGASRLIKGFLREIGESGRAGDVVVVAPDLDRNVFVGIPAVYQRLWSLRGELEDPDVRQLANLDKAAHVYVLADEPERAAPPPDRAAQRLATLRSVRGAVLAVQADNTRAHLCVYVSGPPWLSTGRLVRRCLADDREDWCLELKRHDIARAAAASPGFLSLWIELMSFRATPLEPAYPHVNVRVYAVSAKGTRGLGMRGALRSLESAFRSIVRAFPWAGDPSRLVRVLGTVRLKRNADPSDGFVPEFCCDVPEKPGNEDHVIVVSTHRPSMAEVRVAIRSRRPSTPAVHVGTPHTDQSGLPTDPEMDEFDRISSVLERAPGRPYLAVVNDEDPRTHDMIREATTQALRHEIEQMPDRVGRLRDLRPIPGLVGPLGHLSFRWSRRRVVRKALHPDTDPDDAIREVTRFLLGWSDRLVGDLPRSIGESWLHATSFDRIAHLLLAHHAVDGVAARLYEQWINGEGVKVRTWTGEDAAFPDVAAELGSESLCLLGVRTFRTDAEGARRPGRVLGPWLIDDRGRILDTPVRKGDKLYAVRYDS